LELMHSSLPEIGHGRPCAGDQDIRAVISRRSPALTELGPVIVARSGKTLTPWLASVLP
jgi:hypothetical protein